MHHLALLHRQFILQLENRRPQRLDTRQVMFRDKNVVAGLRIDRPTQRRYLAAECAEAQKSPIDRGVERIGAPRGNFLKFWSDEEILNIVGRTCAESSAGGSRDWHLADCLRVQSPRR